MTFWCDVTDKPLTVDATRRLLSFAATTRGSPKSSSRASSSYAHSAVRAALRPHVRDLRPWPTISRPTLVSLLSFDRCHRTPCRRHGRSCLIFASTICSCQVAPDRRRTCDTRSRHCSRFPAAVLKRASSPRCQVASACGTSNSRRATRSSVPTNPLCST
jgi:hypothetical protein